MNNKLIMGVLGIVVGIILLGGLLVPVLNDATEDYSKNNLIGYSATIADSSQKVDMVLHVENQVLTVNGMTYAYSINDVAMISDVAYLTTTTVSPFCTYVHGGTTVSNPKSITVTIHDGTIEAEWTLQDNSTGSESKPYSWVAFRNNAGEDRIFNTITSAKTVYYSESAPVYGVAPNSGAVVSFVGDSAAFNGASYEATMSGTAVMGDIYQGVISYGNTSNLSTTINGSEYRPFYGAVEGQVFASNDSKAIDGLYWTIPVLVLVGLLGGAIAIVTRRY